MEEIENLKGKMEDLIDRYQTAKDLEESGFTRQEILREYYESILMPLQVKK